MQLLQPIRSHLSRRHINVPDDWLSACIEWVLSEYTQQNVLFIQDKVYQEWLHADLSELATSCLPVQLQEQGSTSISGYFPLQINSLRDISEPAYSQLLKVDGVDNENASVSATQTPQSQAVWERKAARMLMLELTDGSTAIEGMEYRPIPNLNVNISPGTKVLVHGTIKIYHGILFLTQENISVLGGKVVTLLEANHQKNVLAAALNEATQGENEDDATRRSNRRMVSTPDDADLGGGGGMQPQNRCTENAEPTSQLDDDDVDFFDDAAFEQEFEEELIPEGPLPQDQSLEAELDENTAIDEEFDDDLDALMSQM